MGKAMSVHDLSEKKESITLNSFSDIHLFGDMLTLKRLGREGRPREVNLTPPLWFFENCIF